MLESCLEVYARHMLFLKLLSESSEQLGMQGEIIHMVHIMYDCSGNTIIISSGKISIVKFWFYSSSFSVFHLGIK